jgi:hypothetical protein
MVKSLSCKVQGQGSQVQGGRFCVKGFRVKGLELILWFHD